MTTVALDCPCCLQGIRHVEKLQTAILAWCSEFIKDANDHRKFPHPCRHLFSGSHINEDSVKNGHQDFTPERRNFTDEFYSNCTNNRTISKICDELFEQQRSDDHYFVNSNTKEIHGAAASSELPVNSQLGIVLNNFTDFVPGDAFSNGQQTSGQLDLSLAPVNRTDVPPVVSKRIKRKLRHIAPGPRCDASEPGSMDKLRLPKSHGPNSNCHNLNGPLKYDILAERGLSFNCSDVNENVLDEPSYSVNSVGVDVLSTQNQICDNSLDATAATKINSDSACYTRDCGADFKLKYSPNIVDFVKEESTEEDFYVQDGTVREFGESPSREPGQYPAVDCKGADVFDSDVVNALVDKLRFRSDSDEHHDCAIRQNICPVSSSNSSPISTDHLASQSSSFNVVANNEGPNLNSNLYLESLLEVVLRPSSVDSPDAEFGSFGLTRPKMKKYYRCPFCEKEFKAKSHAIRHSSSHTSMKYACEVCGKKFSRADSVKRHCDSVHRVPNSAIDSSPPSVPPVGTLDTTVEEPDAHAGQLTKHDH